MDEYAAGELDRRLGNLVRVGTVKAFDPAKGYRVDIGELVTDWLPVGTRRSGSQRSWNPLSIGEQVVVVAEDGELSQGVIVCSLPSDANPENGTAANLWRETFADGTVLEYDQSTGGLRADVVTSGSITLHIGGTVLVLKDGQATLTTDDYLVQAPKAKFTGDVEIDGSLKYGNGLSGTAGSGENSIAGGLKINGIPHETHGHIEQGDGNRVSNPVN